MRKTYYYDCTDGRRAKISVTDNLITGFYCVRLIIRADHGQGKLLWNRTYATQKSARVTLNRRGGKWTLYKKTVF